MEQLPQPTRLLVATSPVQKQYHLPVVVRIRMSGGQVVQGCDVYIGRRMSQGGWNLQESIWMNPFKVADAGRGTAIEQYEAYLRQKIAASPIEWYSYLIRLVSVGRPLTLGCWCKDKPEIPCHGDIIVKICGEVILRLHALGQ